MKALAILLAIAILLIAGFRVFGYFNSIPRYLDGEKVRVRGSVSSVPVEGVRSQRLIFSNDLGGLIYLTIGKNQEFYYGQRLGVEGVVKKVVLSESKTIDTMLFPKSTYMLPRNASEWAIDWFYRQSSEVRSGVIAFYEQNLPINSAAFLSGVVLGVDNGMIKEYRDSLINLGVIHVVAASGMNVSIVASVFFVIFGSIMNRKLAVVFSIVAIAFYIVLAGGQASIVRAGIMGCLAFGAGLLGRQYFSLLALFLTGVGMVIIYPHYIVDVGFQLSFISTLGLLIVPEYLKRVSSKFVNVKLIGFIKEDFLLTLSAQIATLPILFYYFGSYNLLSIIVNLMVLWVIPPIMILGGVAGMLSFVIPIVGQGVILLIVPFLFYFEWLIGIFTNFGYNFKIQVPLVMVVSYYFLVVSIFLYLRPKNNKE